MVILLTLPQGKTSSRRSDPTITASVDYFFISKPRSFNVSSISYPSASV